MIDYCKQLFAHTLYYLVLLKFLLIYLRKLQLQQYLLLLNNIPLSGDITFYLSIHQLGDI